MNDRQFPDFGNTLEWNLVAREGYQAPSGPTPLQSRLPAKTFLIENSSVVLVGVNSASARSYWTTGGWAHQNLLFLPSSTSTFIALTQTAKQRLQLRRLNLVVFPKIMDTWILEITFPYWLDTIYLEVWRYDGADIDAFQRFNDLEQLIT
jgi:hypothetical protein